MTESIEVLRRRLRSGTLPEALLQPGRDVVLMGPPLSFLEDTASAALALAGSLAPILVPFLLALIALGAVVLWQRRRPARPSMTGAR